MKRVIYNGRELFTTSDTTSMPQLFDTSGHRVTSNFNELERFQIMQLADRQMPGAKVRR